MFYVIHDIAPSPAFAPEIHTYKPWSFAALIAREHGWSDLERAAQTHATHNPTHVGSVRHNGQTIAVRHVPPGRLGLAPSEVVAHLLARD